MLWAPTVNIIKFCSRKNLPLRSHRDSVKEQPKVGISGLNNSGNLVELFHYPCHGVGTSMKHYLDFAAQNARCTSPEIQNELIDCRGELIMENIAAVVKDNRHYLIFANEVLDCAMKE